MADAAPAVPSPAPTSAPSNGAAPPKVAPKPAPVVEVKPKAPTPPPGERIVEFVDHNGQQHRMTEKELAAYVLRGKSTQETLTKWDKKRAEHERREADFNAKVESLKADPRALKSFLVSQGIERKVIEAILAEEIQHETLNEDQKALAEERRKREELEAREKQREEEEATRAHQAEVQQHYSELSTLFLESLKAAEIPEQMAPDLFPRMASLYRAVKKAGHDPDPRMFAQHLAAKLDDLLAKRAASTPLEKLESLIGKRKFKPSEDAEEVELDYAEIVHRRKLAALRQKRAGVPGVVAAPVAGTATAKGAIELSGDVVRAMPGDMQNAYWAMKRASPEELPGKRARFEQMARKVGVKI
jgi:hypothetical protein